MEQPGRLKQLAAAVTTAVDAYATDDSNVNYKTLQSRIKNLQVAASTPTDTLFTFRLQVVENVGVAILNELGVFDNLVARGDVPTTAAELAKLGGHDELVVVRLMRLACALRFCDEVDEQMYRANDITSSLVQPGWKGAMRWMEIIYPLASDVRRFLSSTDFGRVANPSQTAFDFVHGKSMWKVLEAQPEQRTNFDMWMHERKKHEETLWHRRYPVMDSLTPEVLRKGDDAALMVDVGGSTGSQLVNFKTQFPQLPGRFVLQDLPETINGLSNHPEGVEIMAYDFFTPQPIKGARFYYFRSIFHNWPDDECLKILKNVVPSMDPEYSTLLIDDYVLPSKDAQLRSAVADIHMMCMFNSSERTESEYRGMLAQAGLEITAIYPAGVNEECVIEARCKRT